MAIVVDVFAMIYTVYITVDEYISKPLGLRSVRAKLRLMFLDLLFIVLGAANLALAMEGISHGQGCGSDDSVKTCHLQKALAGVLQIVLVAWLVTFAISLFRYISCAHLLEDETLTSKQINRTCGTELSALYFILLGADSAVLVNDTT